VTDLLTQLQAGLPGHYRVERQLGEGGMAVVFLATDLKHQRQVAIKVLRPELSVAIGADRFLHEIRVTAQLQHPHILPLYDSGAIGELLYYVMPLVSGESLRDRLTREHQLPVDEAVAMTQALAGALDYAHRQGILHRDIKPENILLHDGQAMLADFGIALAVSLAGGSRLTHTGITVGTPSYMSPEQVAGERTLDARSDIYSLACVAYEMLTGQTPFTGRSVQAVLAAVMNEEVAPLTERRRTVPEGVAAAIHKGLERLPADRFSTAAEFRAALTSGPRAPVRPRSRGRRTAVGVTLGATAGLIVGVLAHLMVAPSHPDPVRRLNMVLADGAPVALEGPAQSAEWYGAMALAPAGGQLALVARHGTTTVLMVRSLDGDSAVALPGTEGASDPFYSPDGAWIGFFSGNLLRKVAATGGAPITLSQVDRVTGAAWVTADRILVLENEGFDLHWISVESTMHLATQFGTPDVLPGGRWVAGQLGSGQLALLSLTDGTELAITHRGVLPLASVRQVDLLFGTSPRWIRPGYLAYGAGDGQLMAMPFDGERRKVLGESVPVLTGMRMEAGFGSAEFALSRDGTLAYVPGSSQFYVKAAFVNSDGRLDTLPLPRGPYTQPRISPDGSTLAVQERNPVGGWQVLLMDLATGSRQQVNVRGNYRAFPASWLPSGRALMIGLWDPVQFLNYGAVIQSLDTGEATDLHLTDVSYMSVAPDGRSLVYSNWRSKDLYVRGLGPDTTTIAIPAKGIAASFSPDGHWLAWGGVNGAVEASPVPPTGAIYQVADRGRMPLWTPRGDALVYRDGARYYRVPVSTSGGFHAGRPQLLVEGSFLSTFAWNHTMSPDGRILVLLCSPAREAGTLQVITGFPTLLQRLAGARSR
jgi:serine/threonine-protein kinase